MTIFLSEQENSGACLSGPTVLFSHWLGPPQKGLNSTVEVDLGDLTVEAVS